MFGKKNIGRFLGVSLATVGVFLIAEEFHGLIRDLNITLIVFLLAALWTVLYFAGVWATSDRRDELDRKFPISSSELRKQKTAFYDWLASQGRREVRKNRHR